ncbi:hypothetical protein ACFQX4_26730 [Roseomonas sp. GCM10028921]
MTTNQINHDATHDAPGAAVAHAAGRTHHLPDLSVEWPDRVVLRRHGIEVKAKSPLASGAWGWDRRAFGRASEYAAAFRTPVLYVIRDLSDAPLPPVHELDHPDHYWFATTWKLLHSPNRSSDAHHHYWLAEDFAPLALLLDGTHLAAATVPYVPMRDGPPMLL